jgi:hypothetical protein
MFEIGLFLCLDKKPGAKPGKEGGHGKGKDFGKEDSHEKGKDFGKEHGGFEKQPPPSKHGENGKGPQFQAGEGDNNDDGEFYSY